MNKKQTNDESQLFAESCFWALLYSIDGMKILKNDRRIEYDDSTNFGNSFVCYYVCFNRA